MRFMQMESTTFLVREKGLDPKAFRIQATCLVCRGYIREQIERVFIPFCPATEKHNRAIGGADFSWGRAGIAAKIRYAFGIPRQGFQRRPLPDAMPERQHTR